MNMNTRVRIQQKRKLTKRYTRAEKGFITFCVISFFAIAKSFLHFLNKKRAISFSEAELVRCEQRRIKENYGRSVRIPNSANTHGENLTIQH